MSKLISNIEQEILHYIGNYYLDKHLKDNHDYSPIEIDKAYIECQREIVELGIHAICYTRTSGTPYDILTVFLERPGVLIGEKGNNLYALQFYIESKIETRIKIEIKEYDINQYLIPMNYLDMDIDDI